MLRNLPAKKGSNNGTIDKTNSLTRGRREVNFKESIDMVDKAGIISKGRMRQK